jgi:nucleoside phosphorylase
VTILVATGTALEARLMVAPDVMVIAGGGDGVRLERQLEAAAGGAKLIVSSGLAGGLDPALKPGDVILAGDAALIERLRPLLPEAKIGGVFGSDVAIGSVAAKAEARTRSGALAVDMESHIARRIAQRHGLPFLAARVISDGADHALPPAALVGMKPDGAIALGAVLASLARHPRQLPALIRTARDAETAFGALRRLHHVLRGAGAGCLDLRQFPLDMG